MPKGKLVFVGLGLYDEQDVSLKGLKELKECDQVFAEFYTAKPGQFHKTSFEQLIGKTITIVSREDIERGDTILQAAEKNYVALVTCGDPMIATTHIDLRLRAIKQGIATSIIHSSSIATAAAGLLGLQNYKFGRTTTLAYPEKNYFPTSPYTILYNNKNNGLHTLVLLDIQAEQQRYMTANEGLEILIQMEEQQHKQVSTKESIACVVARAGSTNPLVAANTIDALRKRDFGPPLHTLVLPGNLHFMEVEALELVAGLPQEVGKRIQKL